MCAILLDVRACVLVKSSECGRVRVNIMALQLPAGGHVGAYFSIDVECVASGPTHNDRTVAQVPNASHTHTHTNTNTHTRPQALGLSRTHASWPRWLWLTSTKTSNSTSTSSPRRRCVEGIPPGISRGVPLTHPTRPPPRCSVH